MDCYRRLDGESFDTANTVDFTTLSVDTINAHSAAGIIIDSTNQSTNITLKPTTFISANNKQVKDISSLVFRTSNTITLSPAVAAANRVYTIPDVLGSANFIMSAGNQTINGTKSLTEQLICGSSGGIAIDGSSGRSIFTNITLNDTSQQIRLCPNTGNQIIISAAVPSAGRTYTLPDVSNSNFVMTEGTQTINGSKTFTGAIIPSHCCRATRSGTQAISAATSTTVIWNGTDLVDTDNFHNPAVNPELMTVPLTGKYLVSIKLQVDITTNRMALELFRNSGSRQSVVDTTTDTYFNMTTLITLNANDTLYCNIFTNNACNITQDSAEFNVIFLGT